ncbi:hypothetical protein [Paenibacillus polymyxa]|uniref:Uncharacterized protein n=1 Tax=Paenibacillus polymyxa (strain SC2) TaxID=886882 RepID=E3EKF9_PAEPS|nr:hypothetical protein [Paenibacillus polymyxa]ADO59791.1 hypothetical protein PPSC2_26205 [Paenibacillus polymyxa SC2]
MKTTTVKKRMIQCILASVGFILLIFMHLNQTYERITFPMDGWVVFLVAISLIILSLIAWKKLNTSYSTFGYPLWFGMFVGSIIGKIFTNSL